jgi:hypothetical protein
MSAATWKYLENQFEVATRESRTAMNTIVADHAAKLKTGSEEAGADPQLATMLAAFTTQKTTWDAAYLKWKNSQAGYGGGTEAIDALIHDLNTKPGPEQNSKIEKWDSRIRSEVPRGGSVYKTLLPRGREPFSAGHRDEIIAAVKGLGTRLGEQTSMPDLVALGTEVMTFWGQLDAARGGQQGLEGSADTSATEINSARLAIATALYGDLGLLMNIYAATPVKVAGFFDLDTLRDPPKKKTAPAKGAAAQSNSAAGTPPAQA